MIKKSILGMALYILTLGNIYAAGEPQSATGVLEYFPPDVQSRQAWYGHNFMVDGVPVKPTDAFPNEKLLAYVGQQIAVSGTWNAGTTSNSGTLDQQSPMPIAQGQANTVVRNEGIMVEKLAVLSRHKK